MLNKFKTYVKSNHLFISSDKILLAISGGKDSMVMLKLFSQSGYNFSVAHCNFNLRGKDSENDQKFVESYCRKNNITCYTTSFNTKDQVEQSKKSTQMVARELRYSWFNRLIEEHNFSCVATAHHKNDVAETMLINLTKGTGLSGLHGISNKIGRVIRPMLCFSLKDIDRLADEYNVIFREDISNSDTKYVRNSVRHNIIPELEKINPSLIETLNDTSERFNELEEIIQQSVIRELKRCSTSENEKVIFNIDELKQLHPLTTYLYYFIKDYGFNQSDVLDIIHSLDEQSGKLFYTDNYVLNKDRGYLVLTKLDEPNAKPELIHKVEDFLKIQNFSYQIKSNADTLVYNKSNYIAYLDMDKLVFPLKIRNWQKGDIFTPFGMKGKKKLSDFFIDNKIDLISKNKVKLLLSGDKIVWVIGLRTDENFKVTSNTDQVLILTDNSNN